VTAEAIHRLMDGIDPGVIHRAETAAASVPGVVHAHARARWTGPTLRVEVEGWINPDLTARDAGTLGCRVAAVVEEAIPGTGSFTWTARAA
jgi:divalent metal cation (Fe/Co/Zn/Cd) transporter